MDSLLGVLLIPFLACLVLTGIHTYLGQHIIRRGVIFVDLALAQMAALGSTLGVLLGMGLHTQESYFLALGFTILGAAVFTIANSLRKDVPLEALVGIAYVVSAACSILVLSKLPEGGEELRAILVGHLLFISKIELAKVTLLYSVLGVIFFSMHGKLWQISTDPIKAKELGINIKLHDFLFYAMFGCVVTSSVHVAGVLLVFAFLVIPSVCSGLLGLSGRMALITGWTIGAFGSLIGLAMSYLGDLPTGACVVAALGALLMLILVRTSFCACFRS